MTRDAPISRETLEAARRMREPGLAAFVAWLRETRQAKLEFLATADAPLLAGLQGEIRVLTQLISMIDGRP
jgi:hypothetical protein